MTQIKKKNIVLIISGPSGCGKSTILNKLIKIFPFQKIITTTTRNPRNDEKDGKEYFFLKKENFINKIKKNMFIEYSIVHNNFYGIEKKSILKNKFKEDLLLNINVEGFQKIKSNNSLFQKFCIENHYSIISIFIKLKNILAVKKRLKSRMESKKNIKIRMQSFQKELNLKTLYDYCLTSKTKKKDLKNVVEIYKKEKKKI
jgi:guanylate kinase